MNDIRKPPVQAVLAQHPQSKPGTCRWCGKPTDERTPTGRLRWWHDVCETEYLAIVRPDVMRHLVGKRDKGICADCGEDWSGRYILRKSHQISCGPSLLEIADRAQYQAERAAGFWVYTDLVEISLWHVDHKTPLWKVAHMPPLQRIKYFKPDAVITRCEPCHQRKTAKEAGDRAKFRKMGKPKPDKPKSAFGSRKMQSVKRPWAKRKMESKGKSRWKKRSLSNTETSRSRRATRSL